MAHPLAKYTSPCYTINMDYQHEQHTVHLIVYHLIWCPKRRRKVLQGDIAKRLEQIIHEVANEQNWQIIRLAIQPLSPVSCLWLWLIPRLKIDTIFIKILRPGLRPARVESKYTEKAFFVSMNQANIKKL
jgi:REP element-mobilizing transposase RayT